MARPKSKSETTDNLLLKKRVAIYLRVSTDEQAEQGFSIPAQKSRITAYCQSQCWDIVEIYLDDGFSGKNLERPAMQQLIKDANLKKFDVLVVYKLDRLSRRQKDVLYLLEDIFETNNIGFSSVTESFDTTTPFGKAAIGMLAVFAQLERETILERTKMGKKEAAIQGRFGGGTPSYGYKYNVATQTLEINEIEANVVRYIFDLYTNQKLGFQRIADILNESKMPPPVSGLWRRDFVSKLLRSPFYIGRIPHKNDTYLGNHEKILPDNIWEQAQKQLKLRYTPIPVKDTENLLTGLIWCAECGSRMRFKTQTWPKGGHQKKYYICYAQMKNKTAAKADNCDCGFKRVETINNFVLGQILDISSNKEKFFKYVNEYLKKFDSESINTESDILSKEYHSIQNKIDRWYSAFEDGSLDSKEVMKRISGLTIRRNEISSRLQEIEKNEKLKSDVIYNANQIYEAMQKFNTNIISNSNTEQIRAWIALIVSKVTVARDNSIKIQWRFNVPTC